MYTAFVLGTTPKGGTGEGPNWDCKRDCLLGTLVTLVFLRQTDNTCGCLAPPNDSLCSVGLHSPNVCWFFFFCKLVWDIYVNWENLGSNLHLKHEDCVLLVFSLSGIIMSIDSVQVY